MLTTKELIITLSASTLLLGILSGCSTNNVKYGDAKAVETVTADFGSTDLQTTAESLTQSLLESRYITKGQNQPKVRLRTVNNLTYEHIDTKAITDKIRIKLLKSGQVRFLADKSNLGDVKDERDFTEAATANRVNQPMEDAEYIITGNVRSIKKANDDIKDVYYNVSMELVNPQNGEILWADEKEIRKVTSKPSLGW
ncbi:MAG: penicillin-binding protein activator LpoB [Sulfuricurvum sp.]|jgi:penicillin-binding protein activator|uniref:penicillin-binding protein activator LpoB n=1 Tax=Sulfuricurvum sp. TaxID=2025608 RepID=UPI002631CB3C|nr:penicillin-binding protein activator LpoB [Sulfuricurvum sp.]MDD2829562.1 penicillin-binding protein activator LpoB [Sulfuricurvum sp.]MDD4950391.1 penicillin-binding protein activator LpoB [Sulfuricurvum sp.]